jgi:hypothetical protein
MLKCFRGLVEHELHPVIDLAGLETELIGKVGNGLLPVTWRRTISALAQE